MGGGLKIFGGKKLLWAWKNKKVSDEQKKGHQKILGYVYKKMMGE